MLWGDVWGKSKTMWPASEDRLQGPLSSSWGPRGNTAASGTGSGKKVPAQLPKVWGQPERGPVGGGCPLIPAEAPEKGQGSSGKNLTYQLHGVCAHYSPADRKA